MSIEQQLKSILGEKSGRDIRLTREEYDSVQHQYCQALANIIWGDKGLVDSLGHTWNMVMDPRFSMCETAWRRSVKVTASVNKTVNEHGLTIVDDQGQLHSSGSLMGIEQYDEMLSEGRYFADTILKTGKNPREVKSWGIPALTRFLMNECPNYFNMHGKPNKLVHTLLKMFQADWLGLVLDYAELSNIDQMVFVENGEPVPDDACIDFERTPVVQGEIEYLDRALMYRAVLKANLIKILIKLGGHKLSLELDGVEFTEMEKDTLLRESLKFNFDELYKALPLVLSMVKKAKNTPYQDRLDFQLTFLKHEAARQLDKLKSGEIKPLDLMDGAIEGVENHSDEVSLCANFGADQNKMTLYFIYQESIQMVNTGGDDVAVDGYREILTLVEPFMEPSSVLGEDEFNSLLEKVNQIMHSMMKTETKLTNEGSQFEEGDEIE